MTAQPSVGAAGRHLAVCLPVRDEVGQTSVGELVAKVPRELVCFGRVLKASARGKQNMIMVVDVIKAADVEGGAISAIDRIRRPIKNLSTKCELVGDLPL